ncbi:MAG: SDR family NAD(P)-dependent oxidoreductase, partial [Myxococcota bacterium]
ALNATLRHGAVPTLWVTRGATAEDDRLDRVLAASLVGLGHVAATELGRPPLARLDLDDDEPWPPVALLVAAGCPEGQYTVRDGVLHRHELEPFPIGDTRPSTLEGTAWITGGLGALGQHTARTLLEAGVGAVVLSGRTATPEDATALMRDFPDRVHVRPCDVSDSHAIESLLAGLVEDGLAPVRVVVHAAGRLADRALATWTSDDLEAVWAGKVRGALNLDAALPELDAFVLFSSAASLVGRAGQATYAAANAVLDRLAAARRSRGQHAVAIQWGPWADDGLARGLRWEDEGITPLPPTLARRFVLPAIASDVASFGVLDVDWATYGAEGATPPALVAGRIPASRVAAVPRRLHDELTHVPAPERREAMIRSLAAITGDILRLAPSEIPRRTGFFDLGFDSLMAVELAQRLQRELDPDVPLTIAFDHPTLERLADALLPEPEPVVEVPVASAPVASGVPEPIAIIGVSCRMPGSANDPEAFWRLLVQGQDPLGPVPAARWDHDALYDERPATPGRTYVREGGFVDDAVVEGFDHGFFGIPAREAASLDPQQRMLLEVSYEALERAGVATDTLSGSPTGVFVGVGDSGYHQRFAAPGEPVLRDAWSGTGSLGAFVSGRIAYALGLHGPNLALNTACSSSLVAIHLAIQALDRGECTMALAGGVHLMLHPEHFVYVSQLTALSPGGRCRTFDADADGYARAEGCAMFVLAPLSEAEARGLPVLAVVRGSAVGHDGASAGLTVPNGPAQEQVLRAALDRARLSPEDVSYVEAHGTGTRLGDPIEVGAISEVYGRRTDEAPLRLGAVKSNVGHLEVAAGAASLLKVVLAMQHRVVPPNLHLSSENPALQLGERHFVVAREPTPWSAAGPLRAGISSFGLAGTNAHLVVEEAPDRAAKPGSRAPEAVVWPLSAASATALQDVARSYLDLLTEDPRAWADLAVSAATTRRSLRERSAFVTTDAASALAGLEAVANAAPSPRRGPASPGVAVRAIADGDDDLVWLFT